MTNALPASAFDAFLAPPQALAIFGARSVLQAMLAFEAALARAQADAGLLTSAAADAIEASCRIELFDPDALAAASGRAGSLAIPLLSALRAHVAQTDAQAAGLLHRGATSQDVIDTAMVLVTRQALAAFDADLAQAIGALLALADREGDATLLARTLMQPASATTLGFKLAGWIAPLIRSRRRLAQAASQALVLQLGGPVGTLAEMGDKGPAVAAHMAERLAIGLPPAPWHTQRDVWVAFGCDWAVAVGAIGKIARDIALLSQAEVGELSEPAEAGRGGSSAMPHKRNPVASLMMLAAAQRVPQRAAALLAAMGQEHERSLGAWQAESAEWAALCTSALGASAALAEAAPGIVVHREQMRCNLEAHRGHFEIDAAARVAHARALQWLAALRRQSKGHT